MFADLYATLPLSIVFVAGCLVTLLHRINDRESEFLGTVSALGLGLSLLMSYLLWGRESSAFSSDAFGLMMAMGKYELLVCGMLAGVGATVAFCSRISRADDGYYPLINFAIFGMMILAVATNLVTLYIGFEIVAVTVYLLASAGRGPVLGMKYLAPNALATGCMLYGMAFVYGETGCLDYVGIVTVLHGSEPSGFLGIGLIFIIAAFGCKMGLVPFQRWAPDFYEEVPAALAMLVICGAITAYVIAIGRLFIMALPASAVGGLESNLFDALWVAAAVTMTVANLAAIQQTNIKRMLAISSIGHVGYMMVGVLAAHSIGDPSSPLWGVGMGSILMYLLAFTLATVAAFGVVGLFEQQIEEPITLDNIGKCTNQHGLAAFVLALAMLSLAGVPPTGGFFGKMALMRDVLGTNSDVLLGLILLAVINSALGVYYYLRVILYAFTTDGEAEMPYSLHASVLSILAVLAISSLQVGLFPGKWVDASTTAAAELARDASHTAEKKALNPRHHNYSF